MSTDTMHTNADRIELERLIGVSNFRTPQSPEDFGDSADIATALKSALERPVDYPPLSESVFPGDSVAIVLQPELPAAKLLLDSLIQALLECNIEPTDICVVVTAKTAGVLGLDPESLHAIEQEYPIVESFHSVRFVIHDPSDEQAVAYLAANQEGLPVMVSRPIFDADVVLPIGYPVSKKDETQSVSSLDHSIYPEFSNEETRHRFRSEGSSSEFDGEVRMVNDNIGIFSSLQVVPGPAGGINNVFSGDRHRVCEMAQTAFASAWSVPKQESVDLCIATIEGEGDLQTWDDFVKALLVVDELVPGNAPIVIWSEINKAPESEFRKACSMQFDEQDSHKKLPGHLRRAANIMQERGVFLRSRLGQAVVERLGIGFVGQAADLSRMIAEVSSGLFLKDAHRCLVAGLDSKC